ncbi:cupin domain-containing protein [Streptomyces sp. URMC 127]|uniref:cupin domain-containing protein n=1 Tax=Streptomyces sp. URMC 127 TaxID=3423402 RepID=UPI003F1DEF9E
MRVIPASVTGTRIASFLLAAGAVTATAACTSAAGREPAAEPATTAAASRQPAAPPSPLVEQALPNVKGKTFTSRVVDFPPGGRAAPHRHGEAFVYAYVLEGAVRSRLDNEPVRTYHRGENWVEQPGAHHVTTENTSTTEPARLLVVFVSTTGDELKVDDPPR